jgi:hypothetical protein
MPTIILLLHVHIWHLARPSSVTGDEWSQSDWRRTDMGTSSVSNGIVGLYWSYSSHALCIQKEVMNAMPTIILLLHVHILTARPSFVTGDDWSQSNWRRTDMGTSSVSNGRVGLYWSYSSHALCIQKEVMNAMPIIILLLHVHIWHSGHHFSLVMNGGVKVTEEGQVSWVPAMCQIV